MAIAGAGLVESGVSGFDAGRVVEAEGCQRGRGVGPVTLAEPLHIGHQLIDGLGVEHSAPGRHRMLAVLAADDAFVNRVGAQIAAMLQLRRPPGGAVPRRAMAGHAEFFEAPLAGGTVSYNFV